MSLQAGDQPIGLMGFPQRDSLCLRTIVYKQADGLFRTFRMNPDLFRLDEVLYRDLDHRAEIGAYQSQEGLPACHAILHMGSLFIRSLDASDREHVLCALPIETEDGRGAPLYVLGSPGLRLYFAFSGLLSVVRDFSISSQEESSRNAVLARLINLEHKQQRGRHKGKLRKRTARRVEKELPTWALQILSQPTTELQQQKLQEGAEHFGYSDTETYLCELMRCLEFEARKIGEACTQQRRAAGY